MINSVDIYRFMYKEKLETRNSSQNNTKLMLPYLSTFHLLYICCTLYKLTQKQINFNCYVTEKARFTHVIRFSSEMCSQIVDRVLNFRAWLNRDRLFSFAELLLEAVVPIEPSEEDEERNEAWAAEATGRRSPRMPLARVSAVWSGGDLDGPRGGDAAASKPPRQAPLLPGHAEHRRAQVFQLQNRSRTGSVVAQVGCALLFIYRPAVELNRCFVFIMRGWHRSSRNQVPYTMP